MVEFLVTIGFQLLTAIVVFSFVFVWIVEWIDAAAQTVMLTTVEYCCYVILPALLIASSAAGLILLI